MVLFSRSGAYPESRHHLTHSAVSSVLCSRCRAGALKRATAQRVAQVRARGSAGFALEEEDFGIGEATATMRSRGRSKESKDDSA